MTVGITQFSTWTGRSPSRAQGGRVCVRGLARGGRGVLADVEEQGQGSWVREVKEAVWS